MSMLNKFKNYKINGLNSIVGGNFNDRHDKDGIPPDEPDKSLLIPSCFFGDICDDRGLPPDSGNTKEKK